MQEMAERALQQGLRALDQRQGFRGPITLLEPKEIASYLKRQAASRVAVRATCCRK